MMADNLSPCPFALQCFGARSVVWWWYRRTPVFARQPPCGPASGYPSEPEVNQNKMNTDKKKYNKEW